MFSGLVFFGDISALLFLMFPPITFIWSVGSVVTGRIFFSIVFALFKAYTHFKSSAAVKRSGKTIGFIGFVQRRPVIARAVKVVTQRSGAVMKNWRIPKVNQALNLTQNHLLLYEVQSCELSTAMPCFGFGPVSLALCDKRSVWTNKNMEIHNGKKIKIALCIMP